MVPQCGAKGTAPSQLDAPGSVAAPSVHNNAFPDATLNPKTGPIHTFDLGLWFNSPQDAGRAGCPGGVTPFNGEHNAGVRVLNTSNFPDAAGPLLQVKPSLTANNRLLERPRGPCRSARRRERLQRSSRVILVPSTLRLAINPALVRT